jgi:two-component system, NarL family, nitrate/nitrite response regulator NarL
MGSSKALRIVIVSEVRLYRDALVEALTNQANLDVVGKIVPAEAARTIAELAPDVALLDLEEARAQRTARKIRERSPEVVLVVLGTAHSREEALGWAEAGVLSWTGRSASLADLVATLESARHAALHYDSSLMLALVRRIAELPPGRPAGRIDPSLTARQEDIAELIGQGLSNKQIALALMVSHSTVKNHVHNIIKKLGVEDRADIADRVRELRRQDHSDEV